MIYLQLLEPLRYTCFLFLYCLNPFLLFPHLRFLCVNLCRQRIVQTPAHVELSCVLFSHLVASCSLAHNYSHASAIRARSSWFSTVNYSFTVFISDRSLCTAFTSDTPSSRFPSTDLSQRMRSSSVILPWATNLNCSFCNR